jgi:hypothetical protein
LYLSLNPTLYDFTLTIGLTFMIGSSNFIIWDSTITGYIYSILCAYICFIYILTLYYWFISEGEELRKNNPLIYHCIFICLFIAMLISILILMFNLNALFIFICKKLAISLVDFLLKMDSNPFGGPNWNGGGSNWPSGVWGQPGGPGGPPGGSGPIFGGDPFSNRRPQHTKPLKYLMEDWLPNRQPSDGLPCPDLLISGQEMRYILHQKGLDNTRKDVVHILYASNPKGMKDFLHKWCVDQRFGAYIRQSHNIETWKELSYTDKLWVRKQVIAEALEANFYEKKNIDKEMYKRLMSWNLKAHDKAKKTFLDKG